jgi:hypothetical protein
MQGPEPRARLALPVHADTGSARQGGRRGVHDLTFGAICFTLHAAGKADVMR